MSFVTHVFHCHQRIINGQVVSTDKVPRRVNLEYDFLATMLRLQLFLLFLLKKPD